MKAMSLLSAAAIMAAGIPCAASAAVMARATTPLNIHSGPGPSYAVIGVIPDRGRTRVQDCIRGSGWCQISYRGIHGWSYSSYLTARAAPGPIELARTRAALGIPTVSYEISVTEPAPEIARGAPVAEETVGEGPTDVEVNPPEVVETYVTEHPVTSVDVDGGTVVGEVVPQNVELYAVPNYGYRYAYVNRTPVLIAPRTRQVVYVYH